MGVGGNSECHMGLLLPGKGIQRIEEGKQERFWRNGRRRNGRSNGSGLHLCGKGLLIAMIFRIALAHSNPEERSKDMNK